MIFLIVYNRQEGKIVTFKKFKDSEKLKAENSRLEIELKLNRKKINHEVVILEASKESSMRSTHRRYFKTISGIVSSTGALNN